MSTPSNYRRIVVCVDGTWFNEDGTEGEGHGNNSNVFRIYASVKTGRFKDRNGNEVEQVAQYFRGIGTDRRPLNKFDEGITGSGCNEQIQEVYSYCCEMVTSKHDEVWFFGFSRGAYVCRVVSVLLNKYTLKRALDGKNKSTWKTITSLVAKRKKGVLNGREFRFGLENTREPPRIKFMGLFDTVKMVLRQENIDIANSDLGFVEHIRHAAALNERRITFQLLPVESNEDWMFIEGRNQGLVLEHNPPDRIKGLIDNPLELTFPVPTGMSDLVQEGRMTSVPEEITKSRPWTFRYSNGAEITMHDLRPSHKHGNLQDVPRKRLKKRNSERTVTHTHNIELNQGFHGFALGSRSVFNPDSSLVTYSGACGNRTVVHPSVHFIVDCYPTLGIPKTLNSLMGHLESFRDNYKYLKDNMETDFIPWTHDYLLSTSCRILICGNTGVGKSTLLNRVFGISMTQENSDQRGRHDIEEGFESDQHPGIIIHDSEGFQTGNNKEVSAFKKFLQARSGNRMVRENLHAIWLCIDTDTDRPVQSALANVLQEVVEIAPSIPVVIVGTKKDKYVLLNKNEQSEAELLLDREAMFRQRFEAEHDTSPFWPELKAKFAFVSRYDPESIKALIHITKSSFNDTEVSEAMCAAQVPDIDAKIDQAVERSLKFLRATVAAAGAGVGTGVISTMTTPTISRILCTEIACQCFGIPKANISDINTILTDVVCKNLAPFMVQSLSQSVIIWGGAICMTCTTGIGGIPLILGAPLLEAPVAVRMVLKCACDLILILDQAFRDFGKSIRREEFERVASRYMKSRLRVKKNGFEVELPRKKLIHREINEMVPWISKRAYEAHSRKSLAKYREGMKDIIAKYRFGQGKSSEVESLDDITIGNSVESLPLYISEDEEDMQQFSGEFDDVTDKE